MRVTSEFYLEKNVVKIARSVLGKVLFTKIDGIVTAGRIVETEAYSWKERGSHAYRGKTARNAVMYDKGGVAYVYLCYGIHHLFNIVTNHEGIADAVLIRAVEPVVGIEIMKERRGKISNEFQLTSGPGKLSKALGIDRNLNGKSLFQSEVWLEDDGASLSNKNIVASKRIGIDYAGEDALLPWRFTIKDNVWVSA
ncbi:MAG: DNA-3-methyladenine glycosylase [Chryseolinea sp.]